MPKLFRDTVLIGRVEYRDEQTDPRLHLVFKYPDGKSETMKLDVGGVGFREANVTHEPVNTGSSPVRVIEVELK